MAVFTVKCPSCGSATELSDEKEFGFCTECGARIETAEAELYVPDAAEETAPAPASDLPVPVFDGPVLTNAEQVQFLVMRQPQPLDSVVFHNSDECAAYVSELHGLLLEAAARFERMNHLEEATCLDFLERGVAYCDYLDTKRLRFLAGTHEEKGKTVEDYGSFPVSKDVLRDLKQIRESFVEAYNNFFKPKIAAAKSALEETKTKIRELPGLMRFQHSFCTPLMGILTAALLAVGIFAVAKGGASLPNIAVLVVGAALFIAWAVLTVMWVFKGGSARQLYKAADRQLSEIRTYRSKLIG